MSSLPVTRRQFGRLGALSAVALGLPAVLRAQVRPSAATPLRIAVGGQAGLYYLPLTVALGQGFFRDEGLEVQVLERAGGGPALQALQAGEADVCCGAFEHVVRQQLRGATYRSLVLLGRAPQLALAASTRHWPLSGIAGFRGLRVGVTAPDSSTQFLASLWLSQLGVPLDEVSFVGVGSGVEALNALRQGRVHALSQADPLITMLEQRGEVRLLADTRTLKGSAEMFGGTMPGACLYAPQGYVQGHAAEVQALVNALVHALKWLQTASPTDLARVVPPAYLLGDRGRYLAAFYKVRETLSPDGLMPDDGPVTAVRALARLQPESASTRVALDKTFSNDWVRKAKLKFQI
ncbi:MAG: ABC transporter substrate-binding protein [Comamonadaceae bacterium]|nr:ABC transporter substrate-binding protein [Comamonadaceae bacterium]